MIFRALGQMEQNKTMVLADASALERAFLQTFKSLAGKWWQPVFLVLILCLTLFVGMFLAQQRLPPTNILVRLEEKIAGKDLTPQGFYAAKVKIWRDVPVKPIVMLGDSLTEYADWEAILGRNGMSNRGIAKDTTEGVLRRIAVSSPTDGTVFLMIGTNDLDQGMALNDVTGRYQKILDALAARGNKVYAQSVLFTANGKLNQRIAQLNAEIAKSCRSRASCQYLDVNKTVSPKGILPPHETIDGIHLNFEGYRMWAEAIAPYLPTSDVLKLNKIRYGVAHLVRSRASNPLRASRSFWLIRPCKERQKAKQPPGDRRLCLRLGLLCAGGFAYTKNRSSFASVAPLSIRAISKALAAPVPSGS